MSKSRYRSPRALLHIAAVALLVPFIAAPTPGDVGGCGGSLGSQPVAQGQYQSADPPETVEWEYFDRGLCAGICERLRDCGSICQIIDPNQTGGGGECQNDSPLAFRACMRGQWLKDAFVPIGAADTDTPGDCPHNMPDHCPGGSVCRVTAGGPQCVFVSCPHSCPNGHVVVPPYEWDVQVCNNAVNQMSCPAGYADQASVLNIFNSAPSECLHLCP